MSELRIFLFLLCVTLRIGLGYSGGQLHDPVQNKTELKQLIENLISIQKKSEEKIRILEEKVFNQEHYKEKFRKFEAKMAIQDKQEEKIRKLETMVLLQNERLLIMESNCCECENQKTTYYLKRLFPNINERGNRTRQLTSKKLRTASQITQDNGLKRFPKQRLINEETVAFYSYMSSHKGNLGRDQTIIFDEVKTNVGQAYNKYSGTFTAPLHGYYVFTWTINNGYNGLLSSQLVINSDIVGSLLTDSRDVHKEAESTAILVAEVNQGDVVHIRTHSGFDSVGTVYSDDMRRSSFCGWKIF